MSVDRGRKRSWISCLTWFIVTVAWICVGIPAEVKGSFTYFTLNDTTNGNQGVQVGCQPQDSSTSSPLFGLQDVRVLRVNATCEDQLLQSNFFGSTHSEHDLESTLEGKIALVQFSNCSSTRKEFHRSYFGLAVQLSHAKVKGIIFAELVEGKMPELLYTDSVAIQYLLPPTCVVSAKDYDSVLSMAGTGQDAFTVDMSSVKFPIPRISTTGDARHEEIMVQSAQAQESNIFYATIQDPASNFEITYFGQLKSFGPASHKSSISAKVVFAQLHTDCQHLEYQACFACWSKQPSEIFLNSNDMADKIVWIRHSEVGTHCFSSLQEYSVLLQQLGATAVVFGTSNEEGTLTSLDSSFYSFYDLTIPTYSMPTELEEDLDKEGIAVRDYTLLLPGFQRLSTWLLGGSNTVLNKLYHGSIFSAGFWIVSEADFSVQMFECTIVSLMMNKDTTSAAIKGPETLTKDLESGNLMDGSRLVKVLPALECSKDRPTGLDCNVCMSLNTSSQILIDTSQYGQAQLGSALVQPALFPCHSLLDLIEAASAIGKEKSLHSLIVPMGVTNEGLNVKFIETNGVELPIYIMGDYCFQRFDHLWDQQQQVYLGLPSITSSKKGVVKTKKNGIRTKSDIKEDEKVLLQVIGGPQTLQGVNFAGRAEISTSIGALVGEVELLIVSENCSDSYKCADCQPTFSEGQLTDKIVLIPGNASTMGGPARNGYCLKPIYQFVRLVQDKGAKAVIYGNGNDRTVIYGQNGWHESVDIPILNIPRSLADRWGQASIDKEPPLIVFMSGETQDEYKGELNHLLPPSIGSRLNREYLTEGQGNTEENIQTIYTPSSEGGLSLGQHRFASDEGSGGSSDDPALVYGLTGGLAAGLVVLLCVGALLIKRGVLNGRRRRSTEAEQGEGGGETGSARSSAQHTFSENGSTPRSSRNTITIGIEFCE